MRNEISETMPANGPQMGLENDSRTCSGHSLSEALGLSVRQLSNLAKDGIVVKVARNNFDWVASVRNFLARQKPESSAKDRLTKAQADLAELKLSHARNDSLDAATVEKEWASILRDIRSAMLAVPSRAQLKLSHLTQHDVAAIDLEIREALAALGGKAND